MKLDFLAHWNHPSLVHQNGKFSTAIINNFGIMAIENEEYCCIFGELSGGGGAEVPALAIPRGSARKHFHTDAPMGRRCESAFALLSHKKVTKRLWPAASYGKIGVVGYRLL